MPELMEQRINHFAQLLAMDAQRIRQWSCVQAIVAAAWAVEDKTDPTHWLAIAQVIEKL